MLLFDQGTPPSKNNTGEDLYSNILLSTCHVKIATACLLLSSWMIWLTAVVLTILSFRNSVSGCCWIDYFVFLVLFLYGLILVLSTFGWMCGSPSLCTLLVVPPVCCGGAISGLVINYWTSERVMGVEYCLTSPTILGFLSVWVFVAYAVLIITKYCKYLHGLHALKRRRSRFNVDVFNERVFGTPPLKEFNRMEFARCANLSESPIDDIFGDYEPNVALY
ncbi:hypothetical protein RB195_000430 [Necator americanus]